MRAQVRDVGRGIERAKGLVDGDFEDCGCGIERGIDNAHSDRAAAAAIAAAALPAIPGGRVDRLIEPPYNELRRHQAEAASCVDAILQPAHMAQWIS
jgi:hypothetical protein